MFSVGDKVMATKSFTDMVKLSGSSWGYDPLLTFSAGPMIVLAYDPGTDLATVDNPHHSFGTSLFHKDNLEHWIPQVVNNPASITTSTSNDCSCSTRDLWTFGHKKDCGKKAPIDSRA